jgi:hypothetical protein
MKFDEVYTFPHYVPASVSEILSGTEYVSSIDNNRQLSVEGL